MNKKLISILISCTLAGNFIIGCSSNNTDSDSNNTKTKNSIKEEKHMTEEERIATLQSLEGNELVEAYRNLLNKDEINFLNEHGWKIEEEAKYYQDGINLKVPQNYSGNEKEAEKYIAEQMEKTDKEHNNESMDTFSFSWTNNTGNDIGMLEINYKAYDINGQSFDIMPSYEEVICNGETRKIEINTLKQNIEKIEIVSVDIRHVAQDGTHYEGCIPGKWYNLDA